MPTIMQSQQPQTQGNGGGNFQETDAQKAAWRQLRKYMASIGTAPDEKFTVKGEIVQIDLDGNQDRYFVKQVEDRKNKGAMKDWPYVKVKVRITDPRFGGGILDFAPKDIGANFYDGRNKDGTRSPIRGGMYHVHYAATGQEPPAALVRGNGSWNTDDYERKPLLLRLIYRGLEEEGSAYFGKKANMKLFLDGFERDPEAHRSPLADLDDDDLADDPFVPNAKRPPDAVIEEMRQHGITNGPPPWTDVPMAHDAPPVYGNITAEPKNREEAVAQYQAARKGPADLSDLDSDEFD